MADSHPKLSRRHRLVAVLRQAGDVVRIEDAALTLNLDRNRAAKLLARWTDQGWLRRVGPGAYVPVALELLNSAQVVDDPWVLVPALFAPAYIGGRTAAEYWDLTEQLFRDVVVFTAKPVRARSVQSQGALFTLKHVREEMIFGTKSVWRGQSRIAVSDVHRTIVDMLDDPAIGGGIQHVEDCFKNYLARSDASPDTLIDYALRLGNGAVLKRLGFLAERHPAADPIAAAASDHLTKGYAKLDPALDCPRIITRWRLRIPESWREAKS